MALDSLKRAIKRIITPEYRVLLRMPEGGIYLQRQGFFGKWHYVMEPVIGGVGAVMFCKVSHAFSFANMIHETRKPNVTLWIEIEEEF